MNTPGICAACAFWIPNDLTSYEMTLAPDGSRVRHYEQSPSAKFEDRMLESEAKERQKRKPADSVKANLPEQKGQATDIAALTQASTVCAQSAQDAAGARTT